MSSWKFCITGTITCLLGIIVVMGLPISIIIYTSVAIKPREPTFTLDHASITGFNLTSDNRLTSFFNIVIRANNPNHKLKLHYRTIRVAIFKDKQNVAKDTVPGFTQQKGNVTMIRAEPVALNVSLKKGPAFDFGFESGIGYLDFDVFMTATLNAQNLEVNCRHAVVNLTTADPVANSSSSNNDNGSNFWSIGCSVHVYADK